MALIDAGVPMKDYVCACNASYIENTTIVGQCINVFQCLEFWDTNCFTDLNYLEETAGGPDLTVAMLPKSGKMVLLQVSIIRTRMHYQPYDLFPNFSLMLDYTLIIWNKFSHQQ